MIFPPTNSASGCITRPGAFVTPGDCFEQPHSVRIGYASDTQVLKDGLKAFSAFLRTLERK